MSDATEAPASGPRTDVAVASFVIGFLAPAIGLLGAAGPLYDEGIILFGGELASRGLAPQGDFFSLYGPMATEVPGLVFRIFGPSVLAERLIGLTVLSFMVIGTGLLAHRARPSDRWLPIVAMLSCGWIQLATGSVGAHSWWWGVTLMMWAIVFHGRPLLSTALAVLAGSFRPEMFALALVVIATLQPSLWRDPETRRSWAARRPVLIGAFVGFVPTLVHWLRIGPLQWFAWSYVVPVFQLRPYRRLPVPPSWSSFDVSVLRVLDTLPKGPTPLSGPNQLFVWFVLSLLIPIVAAIWVWRHRSRGLPVELKAWAVLALGCLPQLVQRDDLAHLLLVGVVVVPFAVTVAWMALPSRPFVQPGVVLGALALFFVVLTPLLTTRVILDAYTFSASDGARAITRHDRSFPAPRDQAAALQVVVDELASRAKPGDRLIVAPADLSRSVHNDMALYHLFDDLTPGTYWVEVNPGISNTPDSGFADDLARADWLIMTHFPDGWVEPNEAKKSLAPELDRQVRRQFCQIPLADPLVELWQRCNDPKVTDG